ncbi:hypothetical protein FACS189438_2440 [Bacteroidia bacterium]|nr:hypothetical protein FACS189438_2440 [Bacteroidia bacterium]
MFAMAMLSLFMSSVSVIVIGISSIVIGIAVNYPLHLVDHIKHERDIRQALKDIIPPLVIGNITTVGAFLSLAFINSNAMRNLGLFGSLLLVGTILFVLIYLPHWVRTKAEGKAEDENLPLLTKLSSFAPETKKWVLWPVFFLTLLFGWLSQYTRFESDANAINYLTQTQQEDMQDTYASIEREGKDIVYVITEGDRLDDALEAYEANKPLVDSLHRAGVVESISGIGPFLASQEEQRERIARWNSFWEESGVCSPQRVQCVPPGGYSVSLPAGTACSPRQVQRVPPGGYDASHPTRREALLQQVEELGKAEGFRAGSFEPFAKLLHTGFEPQGEDYFAPVTGFMAGNYLLEHEGRHMVVSLLYCGKEQSAGLVEALQQAAPGTFAFDSRNVLERMVDSLSGDFNYVLYVCGFIVFAFLLLSFGRIELTLLAFLPLAVSWIWILGLMQLGNMSFNIVNIILATFIFGQGDDYTIFITEGLVHEYTYRRKMLASYKNSITLSALIMFIGIGMLIFAKHPALRSLAEVTMVGMFSVVLMAYLIPPLIFHALTKAKGEYREVPVTLRRLAYSLYAFTVFLAGSALITLAGAFLPGLQGKNERNKLRYHTLLYRIARKAIHWIPGAPFRLENLSGENFGKPAVIISNHQSHLDLMCLLMLTPRLVVLTNDRVWNNPFYGRLIKYAGFYPATRGMDVLREQLADRVANGYSILVFPEGTRSGDCSILRFHRGAFYLAETLGLDILPVFIHGAGHVLPKEDFMLRPGTITMQVHPRIRDNGAGYAAFTKQTRQYYRQQYEALAARIEDAPYFAPFVIHNYIYKGMEYRVRRELKRANCYAQWIGAYKGQGPVLVVNNGTGAFAFLFALVHKKVEVAAIEQDAGLVALARNCAGIPSNLSVYEESQQPQGAAYDSVFLLNPSEGQREAYASHRNLHIIRING